MITEVIDYIIGLIESTSIDQCQQDFIDSDEALNVAAITALPGAETTNNSCGGNYVTQLFAVLYRGTIDRETSINNIEEAADLLNGVNDVTLTSTYITYIQGQKPAYAYNDVNGNVHYNLNIEVRYNKM